MRLRDVMPVDVCGRVDTREFAGYLSESAFAGNLSFSTEFVKLNTSTEIVRRAACVVLEDLNVRGMVRNRRPARAVSDAGMSGFTFKLKYKCEAAGVCLVQADRWFPSTQLCCGCGQVQAMPLNVRPYWCDCGVSLDRDLNAARNLARYAAGSSSEAPNGRGGHARPHRWAAVAGEASTEALDSTD